jgi:hypothetical protein
MNAKLLKSISAKIYRQFPEVSGSSPKVSPQSSHRAISNLSSVTYLITYRGQVKAANGKTIQRIVRVVADSRGQIVKITTSR